jgi:hypothetical protein
MGGCDVLKILHGKQSLNGEKKFGQISVVLRKRQDENDENIKRFNR